MKCVIKPNEGGTSMKPEKTQNFENEKSEEVKKDLSDPNQELSDEELDQAAGGGYMSSIRNIPLMR